MNNERAVDIIVPIYNGYEDLQKCIPSIKKYTDLKKHRLILINDCSPDERIRPYLDSLSASEGEDNILILHNEKNLGFSGNVNKGMQLSEEHDVLLLNSDTIVTRGWLDKIIRCACSDAWIGTVTPLSNSATLCSVPLMCQDNALPEGFTVDSYAELIERTSLHRYPVITVAVGFCMYIKRRLICDVGLFDAETFGRGYGEENDFCNRAQQLGYCHVMCDDTFVYHKGTASFDTAEKQALLQAHESILNERYPLQMEKNHLYCLNKPDQDIRDNLNFYAGLENGKKGILYLIHLDFRERAMKNIGGTQIHVAELTADLKKDYNIFVAARDGQYLNVTAYTEDGEYCMRFEIGEAGDFPLIHDPKLQYIFEQVLSAFDIELVHVHHTQGLSLDLYYEAQKKGIPVITTLHDYYTLCPTILLQDADGRYCISENEKLTESEKEDRCRKCLRAKLGISSCTEKYLKIWRREQEKALSISKELIFPSRAARDIFLTQYPGLKEKCRVIYHGEDREEYPLIHAELPAKPILNKKLKIKLDHVALIGQGLNDIKGWAYLEGVPNEETQIYVELTDQKKQKDCFLIHKAARPDIVDHYGDPAALMCGIDLRVQSDILAPGPLKIHIYVSYQGKLYGTGQTFKGEYHRRYGKKGRLNVAFLGGLVPQKGSIYAREMIPADTDRINWFLFGDIGDLELLKIRQDNCFFSGKYKKEELPALLKDNHIDVVCLLSTWPETFCYTLSEAWMNQVPVLGLDMGAIGERIRESGGGWVMPSGCSAGDILDKLHEIASDPKALKRKKSLVAALPQKSVREMTAEYRSLYEGLTGKVKAPLRENADYEFLFQGIALANPQVGGSNGAARLNRLKNENDALKASMEILQGTSSYKLARKISEANVPFKEPLKKVAGYLTGKK